ncbi:MAG: AAA family ATPase [Bacteroidia bacterium]|nr:AAA family ATPase [Bacteroidia bacterium]MDW8301415.1 AAA family ATPase [Bacteroidia bacterium]
MELEQKYAAIKIHFVSGEYNDNQRIEQKVTKILCNNYQYHETSYFEKVNHSIDLERLIRKLYQKYHEKVVILVDEYDKPIIDCVANTEKAKPHLNILKNLHSVTKVCDKYLQFALLAGVT